MKYPTAQINYTANLFKIALINHVTQLNYKSTQMNHKPPQINYKTKTTSALPVVGNETKYKLNSVENLNVSQGNSMAVRNISITID